MAYQDVGVYFDGRTAARHKVMVFLSSQGLTIQGKGDKGGEGAIRCFWSWDELRLLEQVKKGHEARLSRGEPGDAFYQGERLILKGASPLLPHLWEKAPHLHKGKGKIASWSFAAKLTVISILAIGGLGWASFEFLPVLAKTFVPRSTAAAIGASLQEGLVGTHGYCSDPQGEAALARLTESLRRNMPPDTGPIRVKVVNVRNSNALALPGGNILLLRGLLEEAESPDEVAGVLAHEAGHAIERHPLQSISRALGLYFALQILTGGGDLAAFAGQLGGMLTQMAYSREAERQADDWAVLLLNRSNISPHGLAAFMDRVAKEMGDEDAEEGEKQDYSALFSTHPAPRQRSRFIRENGTGSGSALSPADWQALRSICDGAPRPAQLSYM